MAYRVQSSSVIRWQARPLTGTAPAVSYYTVSRQVILWKHGGGTGETFDCTIALTAKKPTCAITATETLQAAVAVTAKKPVCAIDVFVTLPVGWGEEHFGEEYFGPGFGGGQASSPVAVTFEPTRQLVLYQPRFVKLEAEKARRVAPDNRQSSVESEQRKLVS